MQYTPEQIINKAGIIQLQRPHYQSGTTTATTHLQCQPSKSSTVKIPQYDSRNYAGHSSSSSFSDTHQHSHFGAVVNHQTTVSMMPSAGGLYAPVSPIPISSVSSRMNPYPMVTPVLPGPLSERRNSQEKAISQCFYDVPAPAKSKDSGSNSSYMYPEYLNIPPGYGYHSRDIQNQGQFPSINQEYRHNSQTAHNYGELPDYLNLPPEYRQTHTGQHGPIRSPGHSSHAQNPYPQLPPGGSSSQRPRAESIRRRDSRASRHLVDPHPILQDGKGPSNHQRVPQTVFFDETDLNRGMFHLKPITFRMKKALEFGVPLAECNVDQLAIPKLDDGDAVLFGSNEPYREIRMKILWPGYSDRLFTKRINTRNGTITRISMLFSVVAAIQEFLKKMQNDRESTCERGMESWKLTGRERLTLDDLILIGLVHRGGPNWQPEIWCPIPSRNSLVPVGSFIHLN